MTESEERDGLIASALRNFGCLENRRKHFRVLQRWRVVHNFAEAFVFFHQPFSFRKKFRSLLNADDDGSRATQLMSEAKNEKCHFHDERRSFGLSRSAHGDSVRLNPCVDLGDNATPKRLCKPRTHTPSNDQFGIKIVSLTLLRPDIRATCAQISLLLRLEASSGEMSMRVPRVGDGKCR